MEGLWQAAPTDIKQSIIQAAAPQTARSLCQLDKQSRSICRTKLTSQTKYRVCLDDDNAAVECDKIPMFSKRQFLTLVPPQIEIYPQDVIQLTHQFYSQNYRSPTEGFAVSLRKAKLMNTICAIIRPEFLLTPAAKQLLLPPYVDTAVIDTVIRQFSKHLIEATPYGMNIFLDNADATSRISIGLFYNGNLRNIPEGPINVEVNVRGLTIEDKRKFAERVIQDDLISEYIKEKARRMLMNPGNSLISLIEPVVMILNVFQLSRLLKIAFDIDHYHSPELSIHLDRRIVAYTTM